MFEQSVKVSSNASGFRWAAREFSSSVNKSKLILALFDAIVSLVSVVSVLCLLCSSFNYTCYLIWKSKPNSGKLNRKTF